MDISQEISVDIVKYLQEKKGQSVKDIAKNLSTTTSHIQEIINKKSILSSDHIKFYIKNQDIKLWELFIKAIPTNHLNPKLKKTIRYCKDLSDHVEKVKKKFKK